MMETYYYLWLGLCCALLVFWFAWFCVFIVKKLTRRKKMKIYWDEKDEQIKDKDGRCRYDQSAILELIGGADERINAHFKLYEDREAILKAQLQCGAKGHGKWVYTNSNANGPDSYRCIGVLGRWFVFKCSNCGLEITKTKKELTAKEKEGLTKLGLL